MGSAKTKNAAAARRAKLEEARRKERARERRNRIITITASVAILAGLVGGGTYLITSAQESGKAAAAPIKGVRAWDDLGREHVTTAVDYPMDPPVGGDHNQVWMNCDADVYTKEIPNENAVHSLEHGAVWITYNNTADKADVDKLADRVSRTPYTLMSPKADQDSPLTLTAWGHQLEVKDASDPRVERFLDRYVQGEQTPEPGAACTGGATA